MQPKVLLVGKDLHLLNSRSMLVTHAGFDVTQSTDATSLTKSEAEGVAVVVLCHTMTTEEKRQAIALVRASSRRAMIVQILKSNAANDLPDHASTGVFDGPGQLISTIRTLVDRWESGTL